MSARPVLLVSFDWRRPGDPPFALGTASLAAAVRAAGARCEVVPVDVSPNGPALEVAWAAIDEALDRLGPDAVLAAGAFIWNEAAIQAMLNRYAPTRDVVLGGAQITYRGPGELEPRYPGAAWYVRGPGEPGLVAVLIGRWAEGVAGVHVAGADDLGVVAPATPLKDLPSPYLCGDLPASGYVRWETSRGCAYRCGFCQHRLHPGAAGRAAVSDPRLRAETDLFLRSGVTRLSVLDPVFHESPHALAVLDALIAGGFRGRLSLQARLETVTDDVLDRVAQLDAVLEFGMQTTQDHEQRFIGRRNVLARCADALRRVQARGIRHELSLIYGLPGQTVASFEASIAWCRHHGVEHLRAWPLMLLPGTPMTDQAAALGLEVEADAAGLPLVVATPTMTRADHATMAAIAAGLSAAEPAAPLRRIA